MKPFKPLRVECRGYYLYTLPFPIRIDECLGLYTRVKSGALVSARDYLLYQFEVGGVN